MAEFTKFLKDVPVDIRPFFSPFEKFNAGASALRDANAFVDAVATPAGAVLDSAGTNGSPELHLLLAEWIAALWASGDKRSEAPPIKRVMTEAEKRRSTIGMDKVNDRSFKGYWNFFAKLKIHEAMLQDVARTTAYRDAILGNKEHFAGKIVMDLGAGTGVLGFFALQAGAKHVYAVEASSMASVVEAMAAANGFSDRITVVNQLLQDVSYDTIPANSCDILVSETLSHLIFNEKGCEGLLIARDKFCKTGATILPDTATLHLAPFCDESMHKKHFELPEMWKQTNFYGFDFTCLADRHHKQQMRQACTAMFDPEGFVAPPSSKTWDFKTMKLEELDVIEVPCEWTSSRTSLVTGVGGWFSITLGGPQKTVVLSTGPNDEWTHWQQGMVMLPEPLAVNKGQRVVGQYDMKNNAMMSYDVRLSISLPGTDICLENPDVSLLDPNSSFQKCIRAHGRVVGIPYNAPANFVPDYVKQWYEKSLAEGGEMNDICASFRPAPRVNAQAVPQMNGAANGAPNGAMNGHANGAPAVTQDTVLHFGKMVMVPATGETREALVKLSNQGACQLITSHGGRHFLSPGGNAEKGVVEVVPGPEGSPPIATLLWTPQTTGAK